MTMIADVSLFWILALLLLILFLSAASLLLLRRLKQSTQRSELLQRRLSEQSKELAALNAIANVVSNELGLPETLAIALQKTLEVMDVPAGVIFLATVDSSHPKIATTQGLDQRCIEALAQIETKGSFLEPVILASQSISVSNLTVDRAYDQLYTCGFRRLAVAPAIARGIVLGALFITTHEQRLFTESDLSLLTAIGGQIGVAVENSRFFAAVQHRAEQFRLIAAVGRRFSSILDIDKVLAQVVRLIQQTFGYYHVAIGLIEGEEVVYRMGAGELWDDPTFEFKPERLRVGQEGLSGWVAGTGQPLLVPDVNRDPRYVWMEGSRCLSELVVPVVTKGNVIGVLDVQSDRLHDFDEADLVVLQSLANQAAIAIENARLYEQAQQLAVVEERARLARDLHDAVTQSIYSLTLLAEAGLRMLSRGDLQQVQDNQQRINDIAQQTLQDMRLLVYELRPAELKDLGLIGALERRLEVVERRAGIEARLLAVERLALPLELEEELYRIAQEALNNSLKHARATAVNVTIEQDGPYLMLSVQDNGRGFEPLNIDEQSGLGLANIRERAASIGATLSISATPDQGTNISVKVLTGKSSESAPDSSQTGHPIFGNG